MMTQIIHNNEKSIDQIHKNKNIYVVFVIRIMLYLLINKKQKKQTLSPSHSNDTKKKK